MSGASPDDFYQQRVPAQFNQTFEDQAAAAQSDGEAARILEGMKTVKGTIAIVVEGDAGEQRYHLNVSEGKMSADAEAAQAPFMTLLHDLDSFAVLERESGDSILGFLGALAGMKDEMKLTSQRIQNLGGLDGCMLFELTGEGGFKMRAHFGQSPVPDAPSCTIRIDGEVYQELRSGELPPQDAFLGGKIQVEGDMQMGMQLALAAMSPD